LVPSHDQNQFLFIQNSTTTWRETDAEHNF